MLPNVRRMILDAFVAYSSVHVVGARVPGGFVLVQTVHTHHLLSHIGLTFRKGIFLKVLASVLLYISFLVLVFSSQRWLFVLLYVGVNISTLAVIGV